MKNFLMFFFILSGLQMFSQDSLDDLLIKLSSTNDTINLSKISSGDNYFLEMKSKNNFVVSRLKNNINYDYTVFYIKTVNHISVFGIIANYEINEYCNHQILGSSELILYDSVKNKCFFIEYEGMRSVSACKIDSATILFSCSANKHIYRIIALDDDFKHSSSLILPSYLDNSSKPIYCQYFKINNICKKKIEYIEFNPKEVTYKKLLNLFELKLKNTEYLPCDIEDNFLLYRFF